MGVRLLLGKIFFLCGFMLTGSMAPAQVRDSVINDSLSIDKTTKVLPEKSTVPTPADQPTVKPKRRLVAALLCLALGPFGMHRLYLGTKPHVAAAYTLTLGGGIGLVPLIDFFFIVFDPNLYKYKDNNKFIMWLK